VFYLLTLWCWTVFVDSKTRRRWKFYALAIALYALALFSKTTACTLPAALLLILWLKEQPITRTRIVQVVPFVVMGVAMGAVSVWWERYHQGTRGELFALNPLERLLVASHAVWFYLGKLVWPTKLTFIYPRWEIHWTDPLAYGWTVAAAGTGAAVYFLRRRFGRGVEVAFAFFVATLSPLLGFIMLYTFRYTFVADHYQYLASIGPIALGSAAVANLRQRRAWREVASVLATALVAVLTFLTWRQTGIYSNIEALWRTTIERNPGSWMAHNNLGIELAQQGRAADAIAEYQRTISLQPDYPEAHYNAANALLEQRDVTGAMHEATIAVSLNAKDPDAHTSLGNALFAAGRADGARLEYETACKLRPNDPDAEYNLGFVLLQQGKADQAIPHLQIVLSQRDDLKAHVDLANALLATHDTAEAIAHFSRALRLAPDNVVAQCNLAWALATASDAKLRDGRRALELAQNANRLSGGSDPVVLRALAAAYAESGDTAQALRTAKLALEHASATGQTDVSDALRREINSYEQGSAYHE
jgi:tetratricopeptide (TPR) repeat protein